MWSKSVYQKKFVKLISSIYAVISKNNHKIIICLEKFFLLR